MKKLLLFIVSILALGCTKENDENTNPGNFTKKYGGIPFKGSVKMMLTQEVFEDINWDGEGTIALLEASDDSVSVVFLADVRKLGKINFKSRGKIDGFNFRLKDDESASFFHIVDETISGNWESAVQEMHFDGTMKGEQAKTTAQVYFKEATNSFAKGSTLRLHFDTKRKAASDDGGDISGCKMRVVPIWSPNGIVMGTVPDC